MALDVAMNASSTRRKVSWSIVIISTFAWPRFKGVPALSCVAFIHPAAAVPDVGPTGRHAKFLTREKEPWLFSKASSTITSHMRPGKSSLWFSLSLVVASFTPLSGQTVSTQIFGLVTDPAGAVIPGAAVTARRVATGDVRTTKSNETGNYIDRKSTRLNSSH